MLTLHHTPNLFAAQTKGRQVSERDETSPHVVTLSIRPPKAWYRRRDLNPHCLVSKTSASCQLGYAGKVVLKNR